jgi:hypothetical protein
LNESSTESGCDDESGHDDSARVLDEVAEITFTAPHKLMGTERTKKLKSGQTQTFSEDVCNLIVCANVFDGDITIKHLLTNEVVVDFYVLSPWLLA